MALDVLGRIGGDHEKALREYFGAGAIYTGEPVSDRPLYLMAFTNRCGSNLLAAYLNALRDFAGFDEELNHFRAIPICRREGIVTLPDYLLRCARSSGRTAFNPAVAGANGCSPSSTMSSYRANGAKPPRRGATRALPKR